MPHSFAFRSDRRRELLLYEPAKLARCTCRLAGDLDARLLASSSPAARPIWVVDHGLKGLEKEGAKGYVWVVDAHTARATKCPDSPRRA